MSCFSCSTNPSGENNHNCSASLLSPSVCVHVRNCSGKKMASRVFAYETSTSFLFVCRNVCEPRTRVVFNVCVCQSVSVKSQLLTVCPCGCVWVILKFSLALQLSTSVTAKAQNNTDHTGICPLREAEKWKKRKSFFFFLSLMHVKLK